MSLYILPDTVHLSSMNIICKQKGSQGTVILWIQSRIKSIDRLDTQRSPATPRLQSQYSANCRILAQIHLVFGIKANTNTVFTHSTSHDGFGLIMVCVCTKFIFKDNFATVWGRHLMYNIREEETPVDKWLMCPAMNKPYVTDLVTQSSRIIMCYLLSTRKHLIKWRN